MIDRAGALAGTRPHRDWISCIEDAELFPVIVEGLGSCMQMDSIFRCSLRKAPPGAGAEKGRWAEEWQLGDGLGHS